MAQTFDVNTMSGSRVRAKIAGHRIHRKDHVAHLEEDQRDQERRGLQAPVAADQETRALEGRSDRQGAAQQPHQQVAVGLDPGLWRPQHAGAGQHQERAEEQHDGFEPQQRRADGDERRAEHERAEDAVEQDAVLVGGRDREVAEHQDEHEDVVHRERLLDDVAGKKFQRHLTPGAGAEAAAGVEAEAETHRQADPDPHHRPRDRFAKRHLVRPAMEDAEVHGEKGQYQGGEPGVEPPRVGERKEQVQAASDLSARVPASRCIDK